MTDTVAERAVGLFGLGANTITPVPPQGIVIDVGIGNLMKYPDNVPTGIGVVAALNANDTFNDRPKEPVNPVPDALAGAG